MINEIFASFELWQRLSQMWNCMFYSFGF